MPTAQRIHVSQLSQQDQRDIYAAINHVIGHSNPVISEHAMERGIPLKEIKKAVIDGELFEASISNQGTLRVALRGKGTNGRDVCTVFDLTKSVVVTAYTNDSNDNHATLRQEEYTQFSIGGWIKSIFRIWR